MLPVAGPARPGAGPRVPVHWQAGHQPEATAEGKPHAAPDWRPSGLVAAQRRGHDGARGCRGLGAQCASRGRTPCARPASPAGFVSVGSIMIMPPRYLLPVPRYGCKLPNCPRESAFDFTTHAPIFATLCNIWLLRLPPVSVAPGHAGHTPIAVDVEVGVARACTHKPKSQCTAQRRRRRAGTMSHVSGPGRRELDPHH